MALKFEITGDNRNFLQALDQSVNGVRKASREIEQSGMSIEDMFKRIAAAAGIAFTLDQAKGFVNQVMTVRGQFQQLEIAFSTMLQSEEKAKELMDQLVETAAKTPFDLKGVAEGAKQLLAYGIQAEDVNETITRLGDIAAGLSIPLGDLVYLYGTTMTQGRMFTMDLRQFMGRGIPMAEELAKQFGVAKEEVSGLVTAGRVSAEAVKNAIWGMTEEGSKFGGLMAKQSASITGQISNIQDAIDNMFNDIGQQNEGLINSGLKGVSYLVEHYEAVGKILLQLVAIYGSYKAAVIAYVAIQKVHATWIALEQTAHLQNALATEAEIAAKGKATVATVVLDKATKSLNATMLANPYVMVAAGIMTLVSAIYLFGNRTDEAAEAQKRLDESTRDLKSEIASERANIDSLFNKLRNAKEGTDEYKKVKDQILGQYGKYLQGLSDEISTLKDVEGAYKAVTKAAREASIARGKEAALKDVQDTYGKNYASSIEKLQSALNSRIGGKQATDALTKIQSELQKTGTISAKTEQQVREMFRGTADYGNSGAWITGLRNNEKYLNDYTKLVEQRFQFEEETEKKASDSKKKRNKQAIEEERKNLQGQLEDLEQSEAIGKKGAELKKKIADLDKELKAYNTSGKSGSKTTNDAANRRQKEFELDLKQTEEQAAQAQSARDAIEQARIASIENNAVREREAQDEQHRLTLQAIDNREEEMKKALYDYNKSVWENQNKNKDVKYSDTEAGKAGWAELTLTKDQQDELKALRDKENSEYARIVENRYRNEMETMRDYLIQYGTFEQQKLAITKDYEKKIADATTKGEQMSLARERDSKLAQLNAQSLAMNIDWNQTFSGIGNVLEEIAKETLSNVREYMKTDEYKGLDAADKKAYQDLVRQLIDAGGLQASNPFSTKTWDDIAKFADDYRDRVKEFLEAQQRHKDAVDNLVKAEKELEKATTPAAKALAQTNVNVAQNAVDQTASDVKTAQQKKDEAQDNLNDSANKAAKGLQNFSNTLGQITSGSLSGFATGVYNLINQISGNGKKFANTLSEIGGKAGGLVGAILQIIDALGDDPAQFIEDILAKIAKVIEKILSDLPQLVANIFEGVFNIVGGVVSGVGKLFGFDMGGIFGGTTENFDAATEKWGWLLDTWKDNLEYERSLMKEAYGSKVTEIQNKTEEQLKMTQQAAAEMYRAWASDGAGWFSHSNGYEANDAANWQYLWQYDPELAKQMGAELKNLWGTQFQYISNGNVSNLFDLSADQLKNLKYNNTQFWQSLTEEARKYLDMIIEAQEEMEKVAEEAKAQLTATTFDSIVSDFQNALSNMDSDAETFADNFEKYMRNAIINSLMLSKYKTQLEEWYKNFANAMETGDELTKQEQDDLKRQYDNIVASALEERDRLRETMNWNGSSYSQEASKGGWESMGEDTGQELNGRFTALQLAGEKISEGVAVMLTTMATLSALADGRNITLTEIRNLMITNNAFLEDILSANKEYYKKFDSKLDKIVTQTK